jgi:hypothetical protein
MRTALSLPPTILKKFESTGEPFALMDSRIYTLETFSFSSNGNYWEHSGKKLALYESDELGVFTTECLESCKTELEEYMSWIINFKLIRRVQALAGQASGRLNYYSGLKERSLDNFFLKVFDLYSHRRGRTLEDDIEANAVEIDTQVESFPTIRDLASVDSVIYRIIPRPGIISQNRICFVLQEGIQPGNEGILSFNGRQFTVQPYVRNGRPVTLDKIVRDYEIELRGEIEKIALNHGKKFSDQIVSLNSEIQKYDEKIKTKEAHSGVRHVGNIGYTSLSGNDYLLYAEIEPFLLEKGGRYYAFNESGKVGSKKIRVGTILHIDSNNLTIKGEPGVLDMPYHHPFVYGSDGRICYNNGERWEAYGIKFMHTYRLDELGLAKKVAIILSQAETNITSGYIGNTLHPVNNLSGFSPRATTQAGALTYARNHGISEARIFHN